MNDLEQALLELDVEWPATPDIAAAVRLRLDAPAARPRRAWWRPGQGWGARLAYAAAALAILVGGTLAVSPEARSTVLRWLGLESVEIRRETPTATPGATLGLGQRASLDELREAGVPVRVPEDGEDPDAVFMTVLPDGTRAASLYYEDGDEQVLVQTFTASVTPFIEKTVHSATDVEPLEIDGSRAYWITGAHGFAYTTGSDTSFEPQRLADSTLLVERDGVLLRVEGDIARERALEIARDALD
jgi:hypothetical protein